MASHNTCICAPGHLNIAMCISCHLILTAKFMSSITYFIDFAHCLILQVIMKGEALYFRNRVGLPQAKYAVTTYSFLHSRSSYSHPSEICHPHCVYK